MNKSLVKEGIKCGVFVLLSLLCIATCVDDIELTMMINTFLSIACLIFGVPILIKTVKLRKSMNPLLVSDWLHYASLRSLTLVLPTVTVIWAYVRYPDYEVFKCLVINTVCLAVVWISHKYLKWVNASGRLTRKKCLVKLVPIYEETTVQYANSSGAKVMDTKLVVPSEVEVKMSDKAEQTEEVDPLKTFAQDLNQQEE